MTIYESPERDTDDKSAAQPAPETHRQAADHPADVRDRWADWLNLALGIWLFAVPLVNLAGMGETAVWNHYLAGIAISTIALFALARPQRWQEWTNIALGAWVFVAPFVLGFFGVAWSLWNHLIVGAAVAGLAAWALVRRQRIERHPSTVY